METTKIIKPKGLEISSPYNSKRQTIPTSPEGVKSYISILPKPVGYRMLIRPWSGEKKTKGGILITENTQSTIEMTTVVGLVIMMGELCYKDEKKFPSGPWCKEGQFVIYGQYAGSRFKTKYGEHRILNDDEIIVTIRRPEDILHMF